MKCMKNMYNIDIGSTYFVPMRARRGLAGFVSYTCSNDPEHWIECEVLPYEIEDYDYKVYLAPVSEEEQWLYGTEVIYASDFASMVESGYFVKKLGETMCVEPVVAMEHLCGAAYLVHTGERIVY